MVRLSAAASVRVTISGAMSIDGKIATVRGGPAMLSSDEDLTRVHRLRGGHDAILVGINTVLSDDPLLTARHAGRVKKNPARIILDSRARVPLASRVVRTSKSTRTIIAVSGSAPKSRIRRLEQAGADVLVAGRQKVDVRLLLVRLCGLGIGSVLVEGGGTVNWEFVRRGLFDRVIVAVSPHILGGGSAASLADGAGFSRVSDSPAMRLASVRRLGDHVVLTYEREAD